MIKKIKSIFLVFCVINTLNCYANNNQNNVKTRIETDICVYGATGAGINAAIAAAREGLSVVIIEPIHTIGGLLAAGFRMQQDVPYPDHLGGLTGLFYQKDINQPKLRHGQGAGKNNVAMLQQMIDEYSDLIQIITDHRLASVVKKKGTIREALFEYAPPDNDGVPVPVRKSDNLINIKAKVYIDASYEGDLMAFSGVSYRVGKESVNTYDESLAGVKVGKKFPGVNPYKEKGNPASGLLSCISPYPLEKEGDSSRYFMGYNFKLSWESDPSREYPGIPVSAQEKKDKDVYELLKRYTEAGYKTSWPNENFNRGELMTGAVPGMQLNYPDGNWKIRSGIWRGYVDHIKTLTDFTGKELRLLSNQNESTNGWPCYLYIRGGRRMIGEYVMTQHDLQLQTDVKTPVGLGYYKVDIYPNRLVVTQDGTLAQEGDLWVLVSPGPYQIPYGAIIPKKDECRNLLVPLCMSASHIAYASIRMEATYMVMGESAGIAAALAVKRKLAVQDIDRSELTDCLKKRGQILEWNGKGYRMWRFNIYGSPIKEITRWETNPEEYRQHPVESLWK